MSTIADPADQHVTLPSGITIAHQTFGDPSGEPLLLVMGLGGPGTWWDTQLCERLVDQGFFVVRYDNRDIGHSTLFATDEKVTFAKLARAYVGLPITPPYSIADMADDAAGLLDHLGIASANVWGVSMGGMIAQTLAIKHPGRVRSLVSMMSTTGQRTVGFQHPTLLPNLLTTRPGLSGYIEGSLRTARLVGSPAYAATEEQIRQRAIDTWDRGVTSAGVARQMLAVVSQPDRTAALRELTIPTSVIHGLSDKMVHVSGGRATALAIPGAEMVLIKGMGHDIPPVLWDRFVRVVRRTADRASVGVA